MAGGMRMGAGVRGLGLRVVVGLVLVAVLSVGLTGCHSIDTTALPRMYVGLPVIVPMRSTGGDGPLTWSATGLPAGVSIDPATGVISGTPLATGTSSVEISAVDPAADGATQRKTYTLDVGPRPTFEPVARPGWDHVGPMMSADGRYIAFQTVDQAFLPDGPTITGLTTLEWDRLTGTATFVFMDDAYASPPAISGDGRFVAFADNAPFSSPIRFSPLRVWDRSTGTTESVPGPGNTGSQYYAGLPALSADGRYLAYTAWDTATDTNAGFLYDRTGHTTTQITPGVPSINQLSLSDDGSTVAFATDADHVVPEDANGRADVFVWDRASGATERITDSQNGMAGDDRVNVEVSISGDGQRVAYWSNEATGAAGDIYLWDGEAGTTTDVTPTGVEARQPRLSADGATVVYRTIRRSFAGIDGLVVWDQASGASTWVTDDDWMKNWDVSADGSVIAFDGPGFSPGINVWDRTADGPTP